VIQTLVSGGQTGVDRGALRAAISQGLSHGGWCPRGRRAEDGLVPVEFDLSECDSTDYAVRTRLNVQCSDATLILVRGQIEGGSALTLRMALELNKPAWVVDLGAPLPSVMWRRWVVLGRIERLNVAGPRETEAEGIEAEAEAFMGVLLSAAVSGPGD